MPPIELYALVSGRACIPYYFLVECMYIDTSTCLYYVIILCCVIYREAHELWVTAEDMRLSKCLYIIINIVIKNDIFLLSSVSLLFLLLLHLAPFLLILHLFFFSVFLLSKFILEIPAKN